MKRFFCLAALTLFLLVGCDKPVPTAGSPKPAEKAQHSHDEVGPSGGTLVSWGDEEYHAELVFEADKGAVTANVLDGRAKKLVPIDAKSLTLTLQGTPPIFVKLSPKSNEGDPDGLSSRFIATNDSLKAVKGLKGSLSGTVKGKNFTGDFEEKPDVKK
jgi:hypothetical protein